MKNFYIIFVYKDYKSLNVKNLRLLNFYLHNKKIFLLGAVQGDEPGPVKGIERFINKYSQLFQNANVYFIQKGNVEGWKKYKIPCKSGFINL